MDETLANNNNPKYGFSNSTVGQAEDELNELVDDYDYVACASISQSYCLEWDRLFTARDYLREIRSLAMCGKLRSCRFRSICWKLFLEVLPETQSQWVSRAQTWRKQYEELKNQLIVNPRNAEAKDLSINNPLSQEVESPWNQFFLDNELRLTIKQDVIRTYPKIEFYHTDGVRTMMVDILFIYAKLKPETSYRQNILLHALFSFPEIVFFKDESVREVLTNVLFCYARAHKELSYKQGMHELLAPLIFVLHCDHQAFLHACELENVRDVVKQLMDPKYLEHDAYAMFSQIMETVEPWYVSKEILPPIQRHGVFQTQPFCKPPEIHSSNVIVTKLTRIQEYLLRRFDAQLHERLQSLDIAPQIYGIRWVRLLFGREFPMQDLLMLWDAIFADGISFDLVDYVFVAMLLYLKDAMIAADYASCLHMLMKYPPIADMQYFIDLARYLREPNEQPKPTEYHYQQPQQYMANGWAGSSARVPRAGGGSLGSRVSQGLSVSSLRRPGSLVIGSSQMSKSSSEPMNLITDTASPDSPDSAVAGGLREESHIRKGSTASLSHIEGALNQTARSVAIRSNSSSQNLASVIVTSASLSTSYVDTDHQSHVVSATGENVTSPVSTASTKSTGKFFVFGGTRTARKQRQKNGESEVSRMLTSVTAAETVCRRCAAELDIHIGTLQKHLLKQEDRSDDDVLIALAGLKQVRDVLKGALKPTCLSDTESDLVTGSGWLNAALAGSGGGGGVKRQLSESSAQSAQSSQSTTPVHEPRDGRCGNRFYVATPDLLSSDTDITSPENMLLTGTSLAAKNCNVSAGSVDNGPLTEPHQGVGKPLGEGGIESGCVNCDVDAEQHQYNPQLIQHTAPDNRSSAVDRPVFNRGSVAREEMTMDRTGSRPTDVRTSGVRFRATEATSDHQRDSSPINRLAGLFKNFAKF